MTKDHGAIFDDRVASITTTPENKWHFAASHQGHLKQISLVSQQVACDHGKIHDIRIKRLETTRGNKWLITGSDD
jgi:hypothetical protein